MANTGTFWERARGKLRRVSERTREQTERAVRMGVLRIDLVSLRRDRTRAHAHLGERLLQLWPEGLPDRIVSDPEAVRLRALVSAIEERIAAKEAELAGLRPPTPGSESRGSSDEAPGEGAGGGAEQHGI